MIGQEELLRNVQALITAHRLPHFIVISGCKYSGRKTFAKEIATYLKANLITKGLGIEDVRTFIEESSSVDSILCYLFADAETMRPNTKSALLKITEEPKENVYILITVDSLQSLPDTLIGRSYIISLSGYSCEQISGIFLPIELQKNENLEIIKYSPTIGMAKVLKEDSKGIMQFAKDIVDYLHQVSGANALKIPWRLCSRATSPPEFDPYIVLTLVAGICLNKAIAESLTASGSTDTCRKYSQLSILASVYLQKLRNPYYNKLFILDKWIIDMRRVFINAN